MAQYSNMKKPAFYIPFSDYLQSVGMVEYQENQNNDIHLLNPTKTHSIGLPSGEDYIYRVDFTDSVDYDTIADADGYIYIFILGHNFKSKAHIDVKLSGNSPTVRTSIVNDTAMGVSAPSYNGFSIYKAKFSVTTFNNFSIKLSNMSEEGQSIKLGCVSLCSKWTPPHTPDLSLTMTREYDGVKTIQTKGGATLSDASYTKGGTIWAGGEHSWELNIGGNYAHYTDMQRTLGRRTWNMKFSYLTPENLMPQMESLNKYGATGETYSEITGTLHYSESFFARVLNRVQGSHIPFIFQPNDTDPNTNPDQWAIARFSQKDFSITQAAPELYSLSMKIRESW